MFCEYCGNKLPEGSKFCGSCGQPVETVSVVQAEKKPKEEKTKTSKGQQPMQSGPKNNKGPIVALCIVLAILVIGVVVLGVILFGMRKESSDTGSRLEKVSNQTHKSKNDTQEEVLSDVGSTQETESLVVDATESEAFKTDKKESESDDLFKGNNVGFIFPNSDTEKLTEDEIEAMLDQSDDPLWDIRIAINELYARHGRIFDTPEIREYFESTDWYEGTIDGKEFDEKQNEYLNDVEIYNRDLLSMYRKELQ